MFVRSLPVPALVDLVNDWGTRPRETGARPAPATAPTVAATARQAIAVADRLHEVFAAEQPADRAAAVTAMLVETGVRPEVTATPDGITASWRVPRRSAALTLRDLLAADPGRVGACADQHCADVYVDASPGGHRRFCSVTCQNRTRVAAFRQRRRDAGT